MKKTFIVSLAIALSACGSNKLPYNTAYPALYQNATELCILSKPETVEAFSECQQKHTANMNFPTEETAPSHYAMLKMGNQITAQMYKEILSGNGVEYNTQVLATALADRANQLVDRDLQQQAIDAEQRKATAAMLQGINQNNKRSTSRTNCYDVGFGLNCTTSSY